MLKIRKVCHGFIGHGAMPAQLRGIAMEQGGSYDTWVKLDLDDLPYAYGE